MRGPVNGLLFMGNLKGSPIEIEVNICSIVSSISDINDSLDFSSVDDNDVVIVVSFGPLKSF